MSDRSRARSDEFLRVSSQFQLGALTTEASHPLTTHLSDTAQRDVAAALRLLFAVDGDVIRTFRTFVESGRAATLTETVLRALRRGGKLIFTGCGSTGRLGVQLVSIWRGFWRRQRAVGRIEARLTEAWEARACCVIAGGDFALVKAVEGFEDFTAFGRKQLADLGVSRDDVVFAMTEGGETPFVIGTAWEGVEAGAAVHFVYNNPDDVLVAHIERSRAVLQDPRIEKINLTTGPMAITGSTRMQATTIQLCVLSTVMEMVLRDLLMEVDPSHGGALAPAGVPRRVLEQLTEMHGGFDTPSLLRDLAALVALEESTYRARRRVNYYAEGFAADVLTDTTERSPTFSTPPFRRFDDPVAVESWAFLFTPEATTPEAWEHLLERRPRCVEWSRAEVQALVGAEDRARTMEIVEGISCPELMRFAIGLDGLAYRRLGAGDAAIGFVDRAPAPGPPRGFPWHELEDARTAGARVALIAVGDEATVDGVRGLAASWDPTCVVLPVRVPSTDLLLGGVERVGLKMLLNALSTCTMALLGRVMGNVMVCVVPSNLKLTDRATRYVAELSGLSYVDANRLLFEVIEYVEPRLKAGQAYPPVVGLAVLRARRGIGNEEAERLLAPAVAG